MALTVETVLEVGEGVTVTRSKRAFELSTGRRRVPSGRYTLHVLDVFSTPRTMADGLAELDVRLKGVPAWVELVAEIKGLHLLGALVEPDAAVALGADHAKRFDGAPVHIRMLNDGPRTAQFQRAIRETVTPDDVVLDIGTGTGVLAVTAALAGARHVYAVETTAMAQAAQRMVDANGVADRVTVIRAHSFDVELPQRADVLVSEIIGDDPLGESIVQTFADARARLLSEGARVIPERVEVLALPLEVPPEALLDVLFTDAAAAAWGERYGLDFSGLVVESGGHDHRLHVNSHRTRSWRRLADPVLLADVDLRHAEPVTIETSVGFTAVTGGRLSGMLLYFCARLAPGVDLSLHPTTPAPRTAGGTCCTSSPRRSR
jgi:16S rRNA G966 N2-methylase RsmD